MARAAMTALWIAVLLAGGVLAVVILTTWRHRVEPVELGTVSTQWLAEQRANDRHQSER